MRVEMKRAILNDVLSRKPTIPLYHYTGQAGLLGIIRDKQIWATHTQYLNDTREYLHALDLVREEIKVLLPAADQEAQPLLQEMIDAVPGIETMNVCVCSFSEERDSLSQWRAYGSGTSSFAIGLSGEFLAAVTRKMNWYFARCIYDMTTQRNLIRSLVEEVLEQNIERKRAAKTVDCSPRGGGLCAYLNRYAPILKDISFSDEQEWRVISRPLACEYELFGFREGRSHLTPYYKFPLEAEGLPFCLHEVVIGPTPDAELSRRSVRSFLVSKGLANVPVEVSKIPYRAW
jgi:Protein of unknown function (DUF2971)